MLNWIDWFLDLPVRHPALVLATYATASLALSFLAVFVDRFRQ